MERRARERWSSSARWAWYIAISGVVLTAYGVVLHRYGQIETPAAFYLLVAGLSLAFFAFCLGLYAVVMAWVQVLRGMRYAIGAMALSLAALGPAGLTLVPGLTLPALHDISTDTDDPPTFTVAPLSRPDWANDLSAPASNAEAEAQARAYPDVVPLVLDMQPEEGFDFAQRVARDLGWEVTASLEPPLPDAEGQIEAVAYSEIVRFADDVAIRVRPDGEGTRFDVRSVSRFGRSDLGANARRIREVMAMIAAFAEE